MPCPPPTSGADGPWSSETTWNWGGDGSRFILRVEPESGDQVTVFDQYVSNQPPDRKWHDVDIPLDRFAGQTVTLTLQTDPGPQGDTTGDWAGWDSPRIVYVLGEAVQKK